MRRALLSTSLCVLLSSCGGGRGAPTDAGTDGPRPVMFADVQYQLTCHETGGCMAFVGDINDSDGVGAVRVTCSVVPAGGTTSLTFAASGVDTSGTPFQVSAHGVTFDSSGAALNGTLQFTVGGATYGGAVSGAAPTTVTPCQMTGLRQDHYPSGGDDPGYPEIEGDFLCQHMPSAADPTVLREAEQVFVVPGHAAHFRIVYCDGLTVH